MKPNLLTNKNDLAVIIARTVLCLRLNNNRTKPSHSKKLTGGGGFLSSILTTNESTYSPVITVEATITKIWYFYCITS